jgi:hypothetical protein
MKVKNVSLFLPSRNSSDVSKLTRLGTMSCFHSPLKVICVFQLLSVFSEGENVLTIISRKLLAPLSTAKHIQRRRPQNANYLSEVCTGGISFPIRIVAIEQVLALKQIPDLVPWLVIPNEHDV